MRYMGTVCTFCSIFLSLKATLKKIKYIIFFKKKQKKYSKIIGQVINTMFIEHSTVKLYSNNFKIFIWLCWVLVLAQEDFRGSPQAQ